LKRLLRFLKDYEENYINFFSIFDIASLQSGASVFLNYCYGCHSLKFSRWNRVAADLEIPESLFFENLVFDSTIKPGDLMVGSMPSDSANWFGVEPPDLTLVTRYKGDDWVYSYLRAYYEDSSKVYADLLALCQVILRIGLELNHLIKLL